ncbi:YhcH/YjgK/YiaL family protein [Mucilaginibacter sp. E4BP6]|uniref:YhcH/YjgK/YiaL family protein n=1 Tax=Mucilaginibacter sp. E4BP6 TaxID=2723089 RepID=UPI0015C7B09D|nr:YhcH/YjgK/YiaL family protein [Mucilaginibacter sp. E4BP6]NYE65733.1 YhcH/YjgK/YiaL family protein [Mucilaginibacter sp. E4BP6]
MKNIVLAQTDQKAAEQWVKSKTWSNGLLIDVSPSVNAMEFYKQYNTNKTVWDKVFAFMKNQDLKNLAPGNYPIDDKNAYATITNNPSKTLETAKWESHQKYVDLQYVISGEEKIGVAPVSTATIIKPYNPAKDAANYTADGTYYIATPSQFFLFFPPDAHRPNIKVDGYDTVKKLVIKIKVVN